VEIGDAGIENEAENGDRSRRRKMLYLIGFAPRNDVVTTTIGRFSLAHGTRSVTSRTSRPPVALPLTRITDDLRRAERWRNARETNSRVHHGATGLEEQVASEKNGFCPGLEQDASRQLQTR